MTLYLYNTESRTKEPFEPLDPQRVTMYVCGPTVYNYIHIGNARPAVVFDTLFRLLKILYPEVIYARNFTDIDDKIMKQAQQEGVDIEVVSERYVNAYIDDVSALNTLQPTYAPRATHHLDGMVAIIKNLMDNKHAYEVDGEVLFDVQSLPDYGSLSKQNLAELRAGASERVDVDDESFRYKKHPADFVLWKPSTPDEPGWDSPWGRGRPGWHTECVVMIHELLGDTIDIHGGGRDLIFPHHENELAQSVCVHHGKPYVRYWLHNAFINFDGEKMSKSLGNFTLVRDLLTLHKGEVLRFALLSAHYRSEQDFTGELLAQAKASLDALYTALRDAAEVSEDPTAAVEDSPVFQALLDDLNTPIAISHLHQLAKELNKAEGAERSRLKTWLLKSAEVLGLLQDDPIQWFKTSASMGVISEAEIESLIAARDRAKQAKDYNEADRIREQLKEAGVVLEDSREGTSWRRV